MLVREGFILMKSFPKINKAIPNKKKGIPNESITLTKRILAVKTTMKICLYGVNHSYTP
jgi:hypothetical protein